MKLYSELRLCPLTGNKDTHGINSMRLAEVWMDEYKRLFYMHRRDLLVGFVQVHTHNSFSVIWGGGGFVVGFFK